METPTRSQAIQQSQSTKRASKETYDLPKEPCNLPKEHYIPSKEPNDLSTETPS